MSLILEALKKSEQQRRLGEAPTLGSPVVATRRRRSLLPVLAILIAIAGAAGWWLTRSPSTPPATPPSQPATKVTAAPPRTAPARPATTPAPAHPPAANPAMRAPDRTKSPEQVAAMRAQKIEQSKQRLEALGGATKATPPAGPAGTVMSGPLPPLKAPADVTKPGAEAAAPAPAKTPIAVPPPVIDKSQAVATPAETVAAKPAAPSGEAVPTIWELPYATRKDLPAIDLSMHVYSADPAQRFVVIKGDRHAEGDELGQDLVLREIQKDGLVLEFKGQKFFYPRTGR